MTTPGVRYPRWTIDSIPYWEGCKRSELLYQVCEDCAEVVFHARAACPYCLSDRLRWERSKLRPASSCHEWTFSTTTVSTR